MIRILEVAYHRNGCTGEPFYEVLALVFDCPDRIVVIDPLKAADTVAPEENSWRGDVYSADLRKAIVRFEVARTMRAAPAGGSAALH